MLSRPSRQVEGLLDLALRGYRYLKANRLESLELIESAVPRVEDFVELNQLFSKLVYFLAAGERKVAIRSALDRRALNLVRHMHERELEVRIEHN